MKILHVITSLRTGGAEKLMVDLLPNFKAVGNDVELLLFDGVVTSFRNELEANGIKIYDLGIGGAMYSIFRFFKLLPFLKKYDIIHTHNTAPQLFVAFGYCFTKARLITTEHNTSNRRRKWKWYKPIDRWMYNRYSDVICISKTAEKNLRDYIGKSRTNIRTINNGIDIERFVVAHPSPLLEQISKNSRKLIMVAGFRPQKDQTTIIKALKLLPENFHLFLVGDGVCRPKLEEIAIFEAVEKRVHFLGIRNDVPELLHAADYVVMSSHFEGLSLSSVEGMCVGRPFLASDVDGLREVVEGAGILFPHEDAKALAEEIMTLENNPEEYKTISNRCNERAKQYDISKMIAGYINVYQSL